MNSLRNRVVVITGGTSGIGLALAQEAKRQGAHVVICARNRQKLDEAQRLLGSDVLTVTADVSQQEDCRTLIDQTVAWQGRIDVLINNAGISMRALFEDVDLQVMHRLMDTNFWGTVYCTKFALPYLLNARGSVVGIISIAGHIGLPARSGYSASKFAVRGFLDTLRVENRKKGLHVLVAAPGFTASNIRNVALLSDGSVQQTSPRDEKKMMSAETAARHILRALSLRKNSLVLTFMEGKFTVFLNKFFPGLVGRLAYNHMAQEPDSPLK